MGQVELMQQVYQVEVFISDAEYVMNIATLLREAINRTLQNVIVSRSENYTASRGPEWEPISTPSFCR